MLVMVNYWRDFPSGPDPPESIHIVTEIHRDSRNKYEYDARMGVFKLNRVLYTYYPCDYGFIPQTLDDDGDPWTQCCSSTSPPSRAASRSRGPWRT